MTLDLLAAVDALTKPTRDRQPKGSPKEGDAITRPSLLEQLRDAIASAASAGGGKSLPSQRIPIDPVALETYERIETAITREFWVLTGEAPALQPEDVLRAWYVRFMRSRRSPEQVDEWTARINGWVGEIERMLNPPRRRELVDTPCILCGKADVIDEQGNLVTAVIVEYREDDEERMRIEQTLCRACKHTWEGEHGASSFRRYADEQEQAATLYQYEVPGYHVRHDDALLEATSAFKDAGSVYGRIRLTHAATPADPVWRFAAHLHDTPTEEPAYVM